MMTYVPAPAVPLSVNEPLTLRTEPSLQVIVAVPIVGVTPPLLEVSPLLGRLSSPPGPAAETVAGATSAAPRSPATASQPAIRNLLFCMCFLLPVPESMSGRQPPCGLRCLCRDVRRGRWARIRLRESPTR